MAFEVFRRHQRKLLAIFAILAMFGFVVSDSLPRLLSANTPGRDQPADEDLRGAGTGEPSQQGADQTDDDGDEQPFQIKSDVLNPEETSIKKQQTEELKLLIENLPIRYRNLITLRYFDELSYEEIAQQLDLPLGTVKAQLFRARYLLGNILNRFNRDDI